MQLREFINYPKTTSPEKATSMAEGATVGDTRVTGLFGDLEQARKAVKELKGAGFADDRIAVAMQNSVAQMDFITETKVHTIPTGDIPSIPELEVGQVLLLVEGDDQAALALEIINRNRGVTGGVRMST